jgi:hypothetical protein
MKHCSNMQRSIYTTISLTFWILVFVMGIPVIPVFGQQIIINTGAYFNNSGTAYIRVNNGGLINNGSYTKAAETLTFSGSTANTIAGGSTDIYNLTITNTGGITTQVALLTTNILTIASGSIFSIDAAKSVTVNGTLTNSAGNTGLVIRSNAAGTASLIHNTNGVPSTVQRYISGAAEAWHFLSTPVAAQAISGAWLPSGTYGNGTGYDLYAWNEPTNCWIYKLNTTTAVNWNTIHPGSNFVVGRGYLYAVQAVNPAKEFAGNLNNGSVNFGLTAGSSDVNLIGFNFVGNPYPSSIDWQAASGWTRSILVSSGGGYDMWIWNPSANNYGVFNSALGSGTNGVTRYIAPMQGYFVRAASAGTLSMINSVRVHEGANEWKSAEIIPGMLSIVLESVTDRSFDESRLLFGYAGNQQGAPKLFSQVVTAPSLYLPSEGKYYSVRYLTDTIDYPTVPVMFKPGRDGDYKLNCGFENSRFQTVVLEDRQLHYFHDLTTEHTYSFKSSKVDDPNRFVLHFVPVFEPVKDKFENELSAKIYTQEYQLLIDLTLIDKETEVSVYDILGRKILQQKLQGQVRHSISFSPGLKVVVVKLNNPDGSLSRKILWNTP